LKSKTSVPKKQGVREASNERAFEQRKRASHRGARQPRVAPEGDSKEKKESRDPAGEMNKSAVRMLSRRKKGIGFNASKAAKPFGKTSPKIGWN